jgi:uncharacterized protein YgbK (DUF1537 family)
MAERFKLIVLDDDPTGSQTVHSCPLLLRWDAGSLRRGLAHPSPLLFVLANTRALDPAAAAARVREICRALKPALAWAQTAGHLDRWMVVSRGDSTLRGHFPLEVEVLNEELGPFDATFLAPAFLPGGRTTVDGMHLLDGQPVHITPFARDRLFGYSTSHLPAWVEQKSGGRIPASAVQRLSLTELDAAAGSAEELRRLCERLKDFSGNTIVAVDAQQPRQLEALGAAVRQLTAEGRRLMAQSAASLFNGLVELPTQPLDAQGLAALRRLDADGRPLPGLVVVGSHVPLADAQLERLLQEPACAGVELPVAEVAQDLQDAGDQHRIAALQNELLQQLRQQLQAGRTPVLYTSRGEMRCATSAKRRCLGLALAALMARLAGAVAPELGYLISKGGITTHTLLADGLQVDQLELQGQLLPGLSLVLTNDFPVVTFPGNLGDADGLRQAWLLMQRQH